MVVGDSYRTLTNHIGVRQQLLFAPFRELVITSESRHEATVWGEDLNTVILPVCHVDITIFVYTDTTRAIQLAHTAASLSKTGEPLPLRGELLDAVIPPVSHIHIAVSIECQPPGHIELAGAIAEAPTLALVFPVQRELLQTMVTGVRHHQRAVADREP